MGVGTRPGSRRRELTCSIQPVSARSEIHQIIGIRPIDRIAEPADDPGVGDRVPDPTSRLRTFEVDRRRLADGAGVPRPFERSLVRVDRPDREMMELGVAVEQVAALVAAVREVVRLLDAAHEHLGMVGEVPIQGRRPRLRRADHDEIGKRHGGLGSDPSIASRIASLISITTLSNARSVSMRLTTEPSKWRSALIACRSRT